LRQHAPCVAGAVHVFGSGLDLGDQLAQFGAILRQLCQHQIDALQLAMQRGQQLVMLPLLQILGQQLAQLLQAEAGPLRRGNQPERQHRLFGIAAIAVGLALGSAQQADAFVKTNARCGKTCALGEFSDLHVRHSRAICA
jgi:hypothetical protein